MYIEVSKVITGFIESPIEISIQNTQIRFNMSILEDLIVGLGEDYASIELLNIIEKELLPYNFDKILVDQILVDVSIEAVNYINKYINK